MTKGRLLAQGRTAEIFAWGERRIVKLAREHGQAPNLEREAAITRAISRTCLPVPKVHGMVELDGRPGLVFERVEGATMLSELTSTPWKIVALANMLADLHASMRGIILPELPSLKEKLEDKIRNAKQVSERVRQAAFERLQELQDDSTLCHGDFHPDNVLISPHGPVIIDWNDAARGNPLADVAAPSFLIKHSAIPPQTRAPWLIRRGRSLFDYIYTRRYMKAHRESADELKAWYLPVLVARMANEVPGERDILLAQISQSMT